MSPERDDHFGDLSDQDELGALEAELRAALQHQCAAVERVQETQEAVAALLGRARALLERRGGASGGA